MLHKDWSKVKDEDLEFIGIKYKEETEKKTNEKKQDTLNSYDKYQLEKLNFLNEEYDNFNTKLSYWNNYVNNLYVMEKNLNIDIMYMESNDIFSMIDSIIYLQRSTKVMLHAFCKAYCNWGVKKGRININPVQFGLDDFTESPIAMLKNKLFDKKRIYDLCNKMSGETSIEYILPILFAREGILGKRADIMLSMKWNDIDFENKKVNITTEDFSEQFDLSDEFLEKLRAYQGEVNNSIELSNYVIGNSETKANYNTILNNMRLAFESISIDRISLSDLIFSKMFEECLKIRLNRKITMLEIKNIVAKYTYTPYGIDVQNRSNVFIRKYKQLTNDTIVKHIDKLKNKEIHVLDNQSEEFVQKISKDLEFYID